MGAQQVTFPHHLVGSKPPVSQSRLVEHSAGCQPHVCSEQSAPPYTVPCIRVPGESRKMKAGRRWRSRRSTWLNSFLSMTNLPDPSYPCTNDSHDHGLNLLKMISVKMQHNGNMGSLTSRN